MTRKEFFEKYFDLLSEYNVCRDKMEKIGDEIGSLLECNVKAILGVEEGDYVVEKNTGKVFNVYKIVVEKTENVAFEIYLSKFCLSTDPFVDDGYCKRITEQEFHEQYVTDEEWKKMFKKPEEDNGYEEYLRLNEKFEGK